MNFRQFAFNNVKRNRRAYSAYFLSSSFAVMIFFAYALFIFHPELAKSSLGDQAKMGMIAAAYVTFAFSFLFVLYSISAFLKIRNKEFGLLTILGAQRKQINKLIFLENILIGFASIVTGILGGLLFAKLFLLYGSNVVETDLSFYLPAKAIGLTIIAFSALYIVISFLTLFFIRQKRVLELLMGTSKPKKEPKAHILLVLTSILLIGTAYYLLYRNFNTILLALTLGILGTYLFFTQFSVYMMRLLKKNRSFFWKGTRMLWVSEMAYKIKDNARMFFMITIVTAMASVAIGLVQSFDYMGKDSYKDIPFAVTFDVPKEYKNWKTDMQKIDQELDRARVKYDKVIAKSTTIQVDENRSANVINESSYRQLAKSLGLKAPNKLKSEEAIYIAPKSDKQKIQVGQKVSKYQIVERVNKRMTGYLPLLVVNDEAYQQIQANSVKEKDLSEGISVYYSIPAWSGEKPPLSNSDQVEISKKIEKGFMSKDGYVSTRAGSYIEFKHSTSLLSFICIFIAAVFSLATASFLYFKLYTDLNQDQRIYHMLSKVGLSTSGMRRACTIQIAMLFFIPLIIAGLEALLSLQILNKDILGHLPIWEMLTPSLISISGFFAVQLIYFLIVRVLYLKQLDKVMVRSGK
ncbi:putative ABC transport system permease protein [Thermoactinomyces sp. DSM 45891]|uniref:ABC transporter permease n=1 Tax=Thermoactinomyces sp. DSM 45891 TaxID=1761907 RepID=UPI00090F49D1|nr:ABC transporter permease [Thermoactinomyces sp. DSM 45891]SFX13368.1 putative ABC transport system permease protein [Thermoactinomyces sp. DSM 45891]